MAIRPFLSRRQLLLACMRQLGSLYGSTYDALEERHIRAELRRMGVPVDPVLSEPRALEEDYWEPSGADNYERRLRDYRVANDVRRPAIVHKRRRGYRSRNH
jgi:hypothetical protein